MNKTIKVLFKSLISVGLLAYLISLIEVEKIYDLGYEAIIGILAAVAIYMLLLLFMALRWLILVRMQAENSFTFDASYKGYLVGMFYNIFMPGAIGGDILRIKYCSDKTDIGVKKSTLIIIVERLFGLAALSLVFGVGVYFNREMLVQINTGLYEVLFLLLAFVLVIGAAKYVISRYIVVDKYKFVTLIFLSLVPHLAEMTNIIIIAWSIGVSIDFVELMFVVPLVYIATVLPISLGGLGVRESVLAGLLTIFGVDINDGILISLMMLVVLVCVGAFGMPHVIKKI